jgi:hypothetical protein
VHGEAEQQWAPGKVAAGLAGLVHSAQLIGTDVVRILVQGRTRERTRQNLDLNDGIRQQVDIRERERERERDHMLSIR